MPIPAAGTSELTCAIRKAASSRRVIWLDGAAAEHRDSTFDDARHIGIRVQREMGGQALLSSGFSDTGKSRDLQGPQPEVAGALVALDGMSFWKTRKPYIFTITCRATV